MLLCGTFEKILEAIDEAGEFVQLELDKLKVSEESKEGYKSTILTIANFLLKLVAGSSIVVAEQNAQIFAADEVPPVVPLDLCGIASREFSASLQQQKLRLR